MKLIPADLISEGGHEHAEHAHHEHQIHDIIPMSNVHDTAHGIEWEDDMVEVNR